MCEFKYIESFITALFIQTERTLLRRLVVHYSCVRIEKNKQYYFDYLTENFNVLQYLFIYVLRLFKWFLIFTKFYHSSSTCEAGTTFGLKRHNVENVAFQRYVTLCNILRSVISNEERHIRILEGVIRIRKSMKNILHNGQKDKQTFSKHTHKTKDRYEPH